MTMWKHWRILVAALAACAWLASGGRAQDGALPAPDAPLPAIEAEGEAPVPAALEAAEEGADEAVDDGIDEAAGEAAVEAEGEAPAAPTVDPCEEAYDNIELMTQVIVHIRKLYVDEKSYKDIAYGALHGMLTALDDHSDFLEPEAYEDIRDDTSGRFSGIGIHLGVRQGVLTVIAPIEDMPAFRAGLMSGDRIVEIGGRETGGMTLPEAVDLLRGPKGSAVTVTILPVDADTTREVEIVRDDIEVPSVKGTRLLEGAIGYVRLTQFAEPTGGELKAALESLQADGMRALVLDLRGNPGGLLNAAVEVAGLFVPEGEVVVTTRGREGVQPEATYKAGGDVHLDTLPIAVLINGGSASAAEIVAGCLQDRAQAVLVGERTYGKASVQSVIRLQPDGKSAIRLTTAYYYTPSGRLIHRQGIEPDIPVPLAPGEWRDVLIRRAQEESPGLFSEEDRAEYADVVDRPLERAADMLRAVLIFGDGR